MNSSDLIMIDKEKVKEIISFSYEQFKIHEESGKTYAKVYSDIANKMKEVLKNED